MSVPINPAPEYGEAPGELPAYLSNGLIGLRVRDVPFRAGLCTVNGLAGEHPGAGVEAAVQAPYPLAVDLEIDGVRYSDVPQQVSDLEQEYDFSCGELHSRFRFFSRSVSARVAVTTLCSRTLPTVVLQETAVSFDAPCAVVLRAVIDPKSTSGEWVRYDIGTRGETAERAAVDGSLCWGTLGGLSQCGVAYHTACDADAERSIGGWGHERSLHTAYRFDAVPGRTYVLRTVAAVVPSLMHRQPDREAARLAGFAADRGFERVRAENRAAWRELWRGRIHLIGASDRWQALADAAFYYLNASAHPSSPSATSMFGLAQWSDYHYYFGHVMWDIDTFAVPPLLLLQPTAGRSLLDFRSRTASAAQRNAQLNGYRGLQFPWEAGMTTGDESTPAAGRGAWFEGHVSFDVALAFLQASDILGDAAFEAEQAWPIVRGVAEWGVSRAEATDRGWEIRDAMGIAEREQPSDNSAFTNIAARTVLTRAASMGRRLRHAVPTAWEEVARGLRIPRAEDGRLLSHDDYRDDEDKAATPEPLAAIFPLWEDLGAEGCARTMAYFLGRASEYVGAPMLPALYGVWAAWSGDRALSLRLMDEGYGQYVTGRFSQTLEYRPDRFPEQPPAGPFMANLGGFLMGLLYGFPALRPSEREPSTWGARPIVLPAGWEAIEVERVWIRGAPHSLVARHGERVRVERTS